VALGLVLWTTDIEALAGFLEAAGCASVRERHPGYARLDAGGAEILLHADEAYRGHPWFEALRREGAARGIGAEIRFGVADVRASYAGAVRKGGLAIHAPYESGGVLECLVMGPDGYLVSFWQPLARND
jgi:hypothetical protein